jgi:prepilin-type N-terminal cleavage/methylation domain-containing protein
MTAGFTLLELLVVLALVGLLAGVAAPRAMSWVEGARARAQAADVAAALEALPARAFFEGKARVIGADAKSAELLRVPPGWRLDLAAPLRYEANGMTAGGRVRLWEGAALRADWRVQAPTGEVAAYSHLDGADARSGMAFQR